MIRILIFFLLSLSFSVPQLCALQDEAAAVSEADAQVETQSDEDRENETVETDELLADEAMMFLGEGYSYDPGDRRDPFKSLLIVRERVAMRGPRPDGIPGLLIDEIDLNGIFVTGDGPVAQVRSTEADKSYLLREGDQLYDGDVVNITVNELVFKQIVDDPTAVKPFREVVKKLTP
ncbi:MAG: pilus assembly protein PilP [Acidobacteriota bacterium]|nr:pilus assembly protein PilP [Acidobacteriota bacterium]